MRSHAIGKWGENLAYKYLEAQGYGIRDCNWRSSFGELDLVALDGNVIVFVEVKTRTSSAYGEPEEALTKAKQRHLIESSLAYLQEHKISDQDWRIDVIAIEAKPSGQIIRFDHYKNALEGESNS